MIPLVIDVARRGIAGWGTGREEAAAWSLELQ